MAVVLNIAGKKLKVVHSRQAIVAASLNADTKTMSDSVRSWCNAAVSTASDCLRQLKSCTSDAPHKAAIQACYDVILECAIASNDCAYYGNASAASSVESSAKAAEVCRVAMAACDSCKSDCGDCAEKLSSCSKTCEECAKVCEANAGIDASETADDDDAMSVKNVKRFDMDFDIDKKSGGVTFKEVKDGDRVVDYQDVRIKGYLSTFKDTTPEDREGDYVEPGAFTKTLGDFKKNPVMLRDHINLTSHLTGSFTDVREDANGLAVEGLLSNAPDCRDIRFKVVEGHLKTLSMGGVFRYGSDGFQIKQVRLFEGSLTPVPANNDARFRVRALNDLEKKFLRSGQKYSSFYHFLLDQHQPQNARGLADKN